MSEKQAAALSLNSVIEQMRHNAVSHVVWLPDSETNHLFLRMRQEGSLALVGVSREGHACSIAAGLYAGGAKPIVLIQNTGLMESEISCGVRSSISTAAFPGRLPQVHA